MWMQRFFGPLDKAACNYFLVISAFFLFLLIMGFLSEVVYLVKNYRDLRFRTVLAGVVLLFNSFLAYFVNRILYNMCNKTL